MSANTIFYGWKRSVPGREAVLCCGVTGVMLQERMATWVAHIPR